MAATSSSKITSPGDETRFVSGVKYPITPTSFPPTFKIVDFVTFDFWSSGSLEKSRFAATIGKSAASMNGSTPLTFRSNS